LVFAVIVADYHGRIPCLINAAVAMHGVKYDRMKGKEFISLEKAGNFSAKGRKPHQLIDFPAPVASPIPPCPTS